ncbi:Imm26 family immunity protein [Herbiconiux liangxiaofengii]|uniref:Imm26 family immunity protein n=1 Tax=Herbiconiux liangxiaofengii TaxID=3342795 RepID=UPI0035B8C59B
MTESAPALFKQLEPSRKRPKAGDIFVMQTDRGYIAGRVIRSDARFSRNAPGVNLIYVFSHIFDSTDDVLRADLSQVELLLPPILTNNQGWLRGYFKTLTNVPLRAEEASVRHAFMHRSTGTFWDEDLNELPSAVGPVGDYALDSHLTIEDSVSRALEVGSAN